MEIQAPLVLQYGILSGEDLVWRDLLPVVQRRWWHLWLNPRGNLLMHCHSLTEQWALDEFSESSHVYPIMVDLVQYFLRNQKILGEFHFRVVQPQTEQEALVLFRSRLLSCP